MALTTVQFGMGIIGVVNGTATIVHTKDGTVPLVTVLHHIGTAPLVIRLKVPHTDNPHKVILHRVSHTAMATAKTIDNQ